MSFDWAEYLKLAKALTGDIQETPNEEARSRSAISRAYYAAFCQARNYLRDGEHDSTIPRMNDSGVHTYVINKFRASRDRTRRTIGNNLYQLRIERNNADYADVYPSQQTWTFRARGAAAYASLVFALLDSLAKGRGNSL